MGERPSVAVLREGQRRAVNPKAVRKHICEELAHGRPIQLILNPPCPQHEVTEYDEMTGAPRKVLVNDPDWVKPDLPDWNMVVEWLRDEEFRRDYEHAMKFGAAYLADEMLVLKDKLLLDPKSAPAYKAAMDMIKWATMIRDPKYSERTIQEIKNTTPQEANVVQARIKQLEEELGLANSFVPAEVVEVKPKISERMRLHLEGARAKAAEKRRLKKEQGNGGTSES